MKQTLLMCVFVVIITSGCATMTTNEPSAYEQLDYKCKSMSPTELAQNSKMCTEIKQTDWLKVGIEATGGLIQILLFRHILIH